MRNKYWKQREEEIMAFRDYGLAFDLDKDLAGDVDLAESGDQLLEIAFQLAFLGRADEGLALARKAVDYYQAALTHESQAPMADPRMAHVYHRLYYARWWITGQEPVGLLGQAAGAFVTSPTRRTPTFICELPAFGWNRANWSRPRAGCAWPSGLRVKQGPTPCRQTCP